MLREVFAKGKELAEKMTNVVMNYTDVEAKVRAATNDDPWGPHGQDMQEIAEYTKRHDAYPEVMGMLWKRLFYEQRSNWRRTYKSLLLLSHLLRNGSDRVVSSCKDHLYDLRLLESYQFIDESGKDQGINIRHKVRDLIELLQDENTLKAERRKAVKSRQKLQGGISSEYNSREQWDDRERSVSPVRSVTPVTKTNGVSDIEKKVVAEPVKLAPVEPVADLLDFGSSPVQAAALPLEKSFDPFFLDHQPQLQCAPAAPSLPSSPTHAFSGPSRLSEDFGCFVSAAQPPPPENNLGLFFDDFCTAPAPSRQTEMPSATVVQPVPVQANDAPKVGSTWANVNGLKINVDSLLAPRKTEATIHGSRSLNQLQQQQRAPMAASAGLGGGQGTRPWQPLGLGTVPSSVRQGGLPPAADPLPQFATFDDLLR